LSKASRAYEQRTREEATYGKPFRVRGGSYIRPIYEAYTSYPKDQILLFNPDDIYRDVEKFMPRASVTFFVDAKGYFEAIVRPWLEENRIQKYKLVELIHEMNQELSGIFDEPPHDNFYVLGGRETGTLCALAIVFKRRADAIRYKLTF
jgi:hypothetical protein